MKTTFFCQHCGTQHAQWKGQCNVCKKWQTVVEEVVKTEKKSWNRNSSKEQKKAERPIRIDEIQATEEIRLNTCNEEFNRVLGGGVVQGSVTLLGGEPGIGKSTLLLQVALQLKGSVLYVSGEESRQQIKLRANRISQEERACFILTETHSQSIFKQIEQLQPRLVIIDSVQTLHSQLIDAPPGSVSQIKQCAAEFIQLAKESSIPVILVGHITKEGAIAGPKILEHMVDTVLQFEGDRNHLFRILRSQKNRFGSTHEIGIYEMRSGGLKEVKNPSEVLISKKEERLSGHSIAATIEGLRPIMIEIQALVSSAVYGTPQRTTTGYNIKRLNMLLAVLEKRAGFRLAAKDVFLNITGGISIEDPATDLAVVSAILSSNEDLALKQNICFAAEVGLSGEIRPIQRVESRVFEAEKLGFERIFISKYNKLSTRPKNIEIIGLSKVNELIDIIF